VPAVVLVGFDAPALNDNDELAFVASVRAGCDLLDVLYYWNGRRLQRLVAERELLLRIGGTMDQIGDPALNNSFRPPVRDRLVQLAVHADAPGRGPSGQPTRVRG